MALSSYFSLDGINIPSKWPFFKYSKAVKMISLPQGVNIFFFFKSPIYSLSSSLSQMMSFKIPSLS